ncbi:RidA family protein [Pseudomonas sp. SIMBA_059]|uniref:RidA family protein n=1 Tax=Pseudomonas palleroniana TaxID=191390 RepID=UPI0018E6C704|nr:RidA family protein [Pseudomonas palleroniana]MBI6906809.1 RidA family protein [Pseudomonas palleroniana]
MTSEIIHHPSTLPFPFSRAVEAGGFIFLSGQLSMTPDGAPIQGDVATQTRNVMNSIAATLDSVGSGLEDVVKVTVWLSDMRHFAHFNEVYKTYFPNGYPVRSAVTSVLAFGLDVEVEVQALSRRQPTDEVAQK